MRAPALLLLALMLTASQAWSREARLGEITLPPGFAIEVLARVPNARQMALGERTLFVGTRSKGAVYALELAGNGTRAGRLRTLATDLDVPNGVAFRNGDLYVAEVSRILVFRDIEDRLDHPPEPEVLAAKLPKARHHGWKHIAFGPDGLLYVPVGAPCNICDPGDPYAAILRMRPDGSGQEIFARGVRNTVGFDWDPQTGVMHFTDNGRDRLGDDLPPDELNRAQTPGLHFGYPYCHGRDIQDPEYGGERPCSDFTPPLRELGPHVASLGMAFYNGRAFPPEYRGNIFIAEHGSWNRSTPIGYRVTRVRPDAPGGPAYEVFARGWLSGSSAWGRPVDVLVAPDGSLLVSDDRLGAVYRIFRTP